MNVKIQINSLDFEIKLLVEQRLNAELDKLVMEHLGTTDLRPLILKRIEYLVDRSKYVSESVIRNLVTQKLAKELANRIILPLNEATKTI